MGATELSAFLALVDSQSGYQVMSRATLESEAGPVRAAMAYAPSPVSQDSATAAAGIILYRVDVDADYEPLGLSRGSNYLWMDAKGPADTAWRGIMISADGSRRQLITTFRYSAATAHNNYSPLGHSRQYCNGHPGCILNTGLQFGETVWFRCTQGCCELQARPKPRP